MTDVSDVSVVVVLSVGAVVSPGEVVPSVGAVVSPGEVVPLPVGVSSPGEVVPSVGAVVSPGAAVLSVGAGVSPGAAVLSVGAAVSPGAVIVMFSVVEHAVLSISAASTDMMQTLLFLRIIMASFRLLWKRSFDDHWAACFLKILIDLYF